MTSRYDADDVALKQEALEHEANEAARRLRLRDALRDGGWDRAWRVVGYRRLAGVVALFVLLALLLVGGLMRGPVGMLESTAPAVMLWEGAAGREPVRFVPVTILGVRRASGGLLGIGRSPSMPGGVPDPREIDVEALDGSGRRTTLRVPGAYLPRGLVSGRPMVLGLTENGSLVRFFVPDERMPIASLAEWAAQSARASR